MTMVTERTSVVHPWSALWVMMVGFFMILLDSTIVAVANPSIMVRLGTGYESVIWVTSAYLLAYAVPLLVAGRLGDRYGPKNLYLAGLAVFTAASLWCGLSGSIGMLIAARVVQGIGAAVLTPQTLSMITRIFPPQRRGVAMSVWGATAGVATLVGPLVGGILVDDLGWEWIFFVNVPIGVVGLALAAWLIPVLPTHSHRFDLIGFALSGIGMFLVVFALQQGQSGGWAPWIWAVLVAGIGFVTVFIYWQSVNTCEPLIPLDIFRDRDFSLSSLGVAVIGFVSTAMVLPLMFYAQAVCGLSPARAALLTAPMAIVSGVLAPIVGRVVDRSHPSPVVGFGFSVLAIALTWLSIEMTPSTAIVWLVLPFVALGIGNAFIWSPLAATATRSLPPQLAGASSGVYNATRQVGAVLGSASMAAFMTSRITAAMPPAHLGARPPHGHGAVVALPRVLHEPFSAAMSQSMLLPAFIALFGVIAAVFLVGSAASAVTGGSARLRSDATSVSRERIGVAPTVPEADDYGDNDGDDHDEDDDDDDYVEYLLSSPSAPIPQPVQTHPGEATEALSAPVEHRPPVAAGVWSSESIGFAHNGFHVDEEEFFRPITKFSPSWEERHRSTEDPSPLTRHQFAEQRPRNKHYRADFDDPGDYGRHSSPGS
jgi:EmrB/QacA subfamily drug resistance transporter